MQVSSTMKFVDGEGFRFGSGVLYTPKDTIQPFLGFGVSAPLDAVRTHGSDDCLDYENS